MKSDKQTFTQQRVVIYLALAAILLLGYFVFYTIRWQSTAITHTLMEAIATFLALFVGVIALIRHYSRKRFIFLLIGSMFLGTAFLDGFHLTVTSSLFGSYFLTAPPSMIPQSWLASRLFLAIILLGMGLYRYHRNNTKTIRFTHELFVYTIIMGLTGISIFVFTSFSLPRRVYYADQFFPRYVEFIPATIFLLALIAHVANKNWKHNDIDHWLFYALIIQIGLHVPFMASSGQLFDTMFNVAHILKIAGYLSILVGLLISTYHLFKQAEDSNRQLYQEISERKQSEAELQRSEEKYRTLMDNIQDGVFLIHDGKLFFANDAFADMIGYSMEETIGIHIQQIVAPEDWELIANRYRQRIAGEDIPPEYEFHLLHKNGQARILVNIHVGRIIYREQVMIIGTLKDITEAKRLELELRSAYQNLKRLNSQLKDELTLAQEIQQGLLPPTNPKWKHLDIACFSTPASEVGGDLYAYHPFQGLKSKKTDPLNPKYGIAVGDVSGKGSASALIMAVTLASFQSMVKQNMGPEALLQSMDTTLMAYTRKGKSNCAFVYVEVEVDSQAENSSTAITAKMVNAGCLMPIIKRVDGSVEWVEIGGIPLGVGLGAELGYESATRQLSKGDMIVLTSDGVVEAKNNAKEMFGFDRFKAAVQIGPQSNALEMLTHIYTETTAFTGDIEPHDDLTIVVVQI
ncbi:SpoIIE family protein phosphatase [Anaerolineales bacterium HSG25]|nr:SpoIIE family protein phosphatase [Anaerolineales bacterium HSG25]